MPPKVAEVRKLLDGMPIEDQLACLLVAIIAANPDAFSVSRRMLGATIKLSDRLSPEHRFRLSDALRNAADALEQPKVQHVEIK